MTPRRDRCRHDDLPSRPPTYPREPQRSEAARGFRTFLVAACALVFATPALSAETEDTPGSRVLREIATPFKALQSFQAEFVQRQSWVGMDEDLVYKGTLYLLRPNRFRIQYEEPRGHLQVSDGDQVWTYVPENGQALVTRLGEGDARGDFLLRILEESKAEPQLQTDLLDDAPARILTLIPPSGLDLSRVRIWTREGSSAILQYELTEASGNRTSYRLVEVRENPPLDPSLFHFEAPEGVPVVEVGR